MSFWLQFAITEMLTVLVGFLSATKTLTPKQQEDGATLISAATTFLTDF